MKNKVKQLDSQVETNNNAEKEASAAMNATTVTRGSDVGKPKTMQLEEIKDDALSNTQQPASTKAKNNEKVKSFYNNLLNKKNATKKADQ